MGAEARTEILGRVRSARGAAREVPLPRDYARAGSDTPSGLVDLLVERLEHYRAHVEVISARAVATRVAALLAERGATRTLVAPGLPREWRPVGIEATEDTAGTTPDDLDAIGHVVTGCAFAVARLGSLVFDHAPDQGRRAITLVPDHHVCVVRADQIVAALPDAIARLDAAARAGRPVTFVSGPSATSDIELRRVEGVHGPRRLDVVVVRAG